MGTQPCGVLIYDARATRANPGHGIVIRPCGTLTYGWLTMNGDTLFAACGHHRGRLHRAGVVDNHQQHGRNAP